MRVRIVCYEDVDAWILGKFAKKMHESLQKMGINSDIAKVPDVSADINHHIIYVTYDGKKNSVDTIMITHVDNVDKLTQIKKQLENAAAGICMSKETMLHLSQMGINKSKLCYVNPAHDGLIPVGKIVIGITCRVQGDGRKREYFLDKLANILDPQYFKFKIMGDGWQLQVNILRKRSFEVEYTDRFVYEEYVKLIPSLDYYLYMGMDEGQMGFIDALAAGVKTIVTAQGYHLDAPGGMVHPFTSYEELEHIFLSLQNEKENLVQSVKTWNWDDYTKKHVEIWKHLLGESNKSDFTDGLNSLVGTVNTKLNYESSFAKRKIKELKRNQYSHLYFKKIGRLKKAYSTNGFSGVMKLIRARMLNQLDP